MLIKTLLNRTENVKPFIFGVARFEVVEGHDALVVEVAFRKNSRPLCPICGLKCTVYDTQRPLEVASGSSGALPVRRGRSDRI